MPSGVSNQLLCTGDRILITEKTICPSTVKTSINKNRSYGWDLGKRGFVYFRRFVLRMPSHYSLPRNN